MQKDAERGRVRSFFRVSQTCPPGEDDDRTQRMLRGDPPLDATDDVIWTWDACSALDSEEGARTTARRYPRLGRYIVRADVPENVGIEWRKTYGPGHYFLKGDKAVLHSFLADVCLDV
jgi:hypothetical protein